MLSDWTRRSPDSGKKSDIFTSIVENSKENTVSGEAKVAVAFFLFKLGKITVIIHKIEKQMLPK